MRRTLPTAARDHSCKGAERGDWKEWVTAMTTLAGDAAFSTHARWIVTAVAAVLGILTLAGVAVLWPRHDPHGHLNGLHAIRDVYEATTISVHRGTCGTAGTDTSQRCTRIRFRLDQGPSAGQFRTIEFAHDGDAPNLERRRRGRAQPRRGRSDAVRLHVLRPAAPPGADVAGDPLRRRRDRARPAARPRRARRAGCEPPRDPAVHLAVDARRQQPAARRHRRRERGRVRRALSRQRPQPDDDRRAPRHARRARAHRRCSPRVFTEPRALHRRAERRRAPRRSSDRPRSTSRASCSPAWCSARSARSTTSP